MRCVAPGRGRRVAAFDGEAALMPPAAPGRASHRAARAGFPSCSCRRPAGAPPARSRRRATDRRADARISAAIASAPSATIRSRPGSASMPSNAAGEATTGRAIAIASSTLFWMPRAILSGATTTSAAASQERMSATAPVTVTRSPASAVTSARRRAAGDDEARAPAHAAAPRARTSAPRRYWADNPSGR